jgi:outer membrane protein
MKWLMVALGMMLVAPVFAQTAAVVVGVIDVQRVVQDSEVGKKALAEVKAVKDQKQKEIDTRQDSIQAMQGKLEKQKDILSPDAQEKLSNDIKKAVTELRRYQEDSEADIQNRLNLALQNMEKQVLPIIQKLGTEKGYSVIISKDALIYYSVKDDITDEVIRLFNQSVASAATQTQKKQ